MIFSHFFFHEQNIQVAFPGTVLEPVYVGQQSLFNARQDNSAQEVSNVLSHHQQANSNLFPTHRSGNLCSDDYTITELQPVNCQPSTSSLPNVSYSNVSSSFTNVPSTSDPCTSLSSANQEGFNNSMWPAVDNQFFDPRDVEGLDQEEDGLFSDGEEENIEDMEMRNKIQQCLILNRDYQVKRSTFFGFCVLFFRFRLHDVLKEICPLSLSLLCICTWMGQHLKETVL